MSKDNRANVSPMWDVAQTAAALGVSAKTVRRLIASGVLRSYRVGRSIRIAEDDLRLFLNQRRT